MQWTLITLTGWRMPLRRALLSISNEVLCRHECFRVNKGDSVLKVREAASEDFDGTESLYTLSSELRRDCFFERIETGVDLFEFLLRNIGG